MSISDLIFGLIMLIAIPIFLTFYLIFLSALTRFMNYLKDKHPNKWEQLGRPSWNTICNPVNSFRLNTPYRRAVEFVRSEDDLGDPKLKELKSRAAKYFKFFQIAFLILAVIGLVLILLKKK